MDKNIEKIAAAEAVAIRERDNERKLNWLNGDPVRPIAEINSNIIKGN